MVHLIERISQKLHRIILLHFGLVTVRFPHGKTQQLINFTFFGYSDVSMTPKTNVIFRGTRILKIMQEKYKLMFERSYVRKSQKFGIRTFLNEKKGIDKS